MCVSDLHCLDWLGILCCWVTLVVRISTFYNLSTIQTIHLNVHPSPFIFDLNGFVASKYDAGSYSHFDYHIIFSPGVSRLQDPERFTQRGSGRGQDPSPVSGRFLPPTGRHEQGHRRVPVQSATLPTIHGHCRLQGQQRNSHSTQNMRLTRPTGNSFVKSNSLQGDLHRISMKSSLNKVVT